MADTGKLYEEWCNCTPKNADFDDVRAVALHFLGQENVGKASVGSHLLIIDGPVTQLAAQCRDGGLRDVAWLQGNVLSVPKHKGKVKPVYVNQLLKLIAFKNQLPRGYLP
jgi:hypothetical protein